ncbi:MAG: Ig-like domain-containing protein, partial [Halobacteriota archaeon]|nr:Ig-like domain-containing protein [Halobacteriota archaeon]
MKETKIITKIESIVLSIFLLLSMFSVPAAAITGIETVSIGSVLGAEVGETYTIPISIDDAEYVTGLSANLVYDNLVVNILSITSNNSVFTSSVTSGGSDGDKMIALTNTQYPDYITTTEDTPIIDVTLTVIGAPGSSTTLDLQNVMLADTDYLSFSPSSVNDGEVILPGISVVSIGSVLGAEVGETYTIPISIDDAEYVTGLSANLVYDNLVVNILSITSNNSVFTSSVTSGGSDGDKMIALTNTQYPDYITTTEDTPIIDVTLTVIGAPGSSTTLDLQNVMLADTDYLSFSPSSVNDGEVSVNRPPELDAIGDKSVNEGVLLAFTVTASDPDGDTVTLDASPLPLPTGATFTDNGDGTGDFSWTPGFGQSGSYPVTFTASDGSLTDDEEITISVGDVNRPPELDAIGDKSVNEGVLLAFTVTA